MFTNAKDVKTFALAGNAILTVSSAKTGARYTFRIAAPSEKTEKGGLKRDTTKELRFVSLLTGPDNTADYTYLGVIKGVPTLETGPTFALTAKSKLPEYSDPVKAARYLCERVIRHPEAPMPPGLEVRHEGKCGCCGRKLTVPESIDRGIGPECASKMMGA
jgi:hypothetical protein